MSLTPSTMMELGTRAPDFELRDVSTGQIVSLNDFEECCGLLVLFICAHCPFVKHIENELARIGTDYENEGLGVIAICSNDAEKYPDDSPEKLGEQAERVGFVFPYLHDESQEAAKAYRAACTPDIFLFDENLELVYRGQLDDSRPGNDQPVTGKDLRAAIDAMLAGKPTSEDQYPAVGCNIKWKPGNAPDYFG
ncbi:MAG: thioredoxin family protein [Verrucomicrobia bacterium]|nr:thioredoxin family protein [Verrucomicrobiota bacterium]